MAGARYHILKLIDTTEQQAILGILGQSWAIWLKANSIRLDSIHCCCVTRGWGHLWTMVCIVKCTRKIINSYLFGISCKCTV